MKYKQCCQTCAFNYDIPVSVHYMKLSVPRVMGSYDTPPLYTNNVIHIFTDMETRTNGLWTVT